MRAAQRSSERARSAIRTPVFGVDLGVQADLRHTLEVAGSGEWFRLDGRLTRLSARRVVLRAILLALAERHPDMVPAEELIARGWPDERLPAISARNRLHVAIHALRTLGLGEVIVKGRKAYGIDPEVQVVLGSSDGD